MFQTELHHYLQQFDNYFIYQFFKSITSLGGETFITLLVIAVLFGFDINKGFKLFHVVMLTAIITEILKNFFAMPRPYHVDNSLTFPKSASKHSLPFYKMGGNGFWLLPNNEVLEYIRKFGDGKFGLPSGHTSTSITIWLSLFILFKKNWLKYLSYTLIVLIPISRLYLGKHFLVDVLTGYLLGFILLFIFDNLMLSNNSFFDNLFSEVNFWKIISVFYFVFTPIVLFMLFENLYSQVLGIFLGINLGYLFTNDREKIKYDLAPQKIILRILTNLIVVAAFYLFFYYLIYLIGIPKSEVVNFINFSLISTFSFVSSIKLFYKFRII